MSNGFQTVDFSHLVWPAHMLVDYIRVYQRPGIGAMGCDPADHPTADYINNHANAYANPNLTTWAQAGYGMPVSGAAASVSLLFVCPTSRLIQQGRYHSPAEKLPDQHVLSTRIYGQ